jgi:anti-sigma-K factor RskA
MTELDDIDALAAEYVLGTLTREERLAVASRRASEPKLDQAITAWEHRLGPLCDVVAPVQPPANLYNKIRAQIGLSANVVSLKARETALTRRGNRWRNATLGMSAMAASLAAVVGWQGYQQSQMKTQYVAVLQATAEKPGFILTVDTKTQMFVISAITAPKQPKKTYEVWLVNDKMPKPKSLGVFSEGDMEVMPVAMAGEHDIMMDATYAVSLEPEGGSPTGAPTGPVLFSGKLVKATP